MDQQNIETDKKDMLLEMCISQGYVPSGCKLVGFIVFALVNRGESPCHGCNIDRATCGSNVKRNEKVEEL